MLKRWPKIFELISDHSKKQLFELIKNPFQFFIQKQHNMSKQSFVFPEIAEYDDYVESWYPIIEDLTFKTWIFNFTLEEGKMLHQAIIQSFHKKPLSENDQQQYDQFLTKVKDFFEQVKKESPPNSGFFLRLGSRSMKDAVFYSKNALKRITDMLYEKYLTEYHELKLQTREEKISWVNQKCQMKDLYYITECDIKALKCQTVDDMFELFMNSERILVDLGREKKYTTPKFSLNFRLWDDRLLYENEFRGFVYRHKFCALTQYDDRLYYPNVYRNKNKILAAITELYEQKVMPRMLKNCPLKDGTYVIDFGVIFDGENIVDTIVIEINRFHKTTGESLFNWDKDIEVLTGEKEFEFRLVSENQYNDVDYDHVIYPELASLKNEVKAKIVNDYKSFFERYVTWRDVVVPKSK